MKCTTCTSGASAATLIRCLAMWASPICARQSARTFYRKFASNWPGTSTSITPPSNSSWRCVRWRTAASYPSARSTDMDTRTELGTIGWLLTFENDFQRVGFEDAGDLMPRMHCPGTCAVQLEVNLPMRKRLSRLAETFICQRQVVMRVGIGGRQADGGGVSGHSFGDAARLVEHVAKVEVRQRIAGIGRHGVTVVLLTQDEVLPVVIQSAQIDVGGSVIGIEFQHPRVGADGVLVCAGVPFQGHASSEQFGRGLELRNRLDLASGDDGAHRSKIHQELTGDGLERTAIVTEGHTRSHIVGTRFQQRIFHAGHLPLHGLQRLANDRRTHPLAEKIANFLDLEEIVPSKNIADGNNAGSLPACELPGGDMQEP